MFVATKSLALDYEVRKTILFLNSMVLYMALVNPCFAWRARLLAFLGCCSADDSSGGNLKMRSPKV